MEGWEKLGGVFKAHWRCSPGFTGEKTEAQGQISSLFNADFTPKKRKKENEQLVFEQPSGHKKIQQKREKEPKLNLLDFKRRYLFLTPQICIVQTLHFAAARVLIALFLTPFVPTDPRIFEMISNYKVVWGRSRFFLEPRLC